MSSYRKRRSSEDLESDSKRVSYNRRDSGLYVKKEYNPHGDRMDYIGVSYKDTPVRIQSAAVYEPQRYFNYQYFDSYKNTEKGNAITSSSNCKYQDAIIMYDERRHMNFKHEVYLNSLRQSNSRHVNFNDLKRHLSDVDIRCLSNWKFVTAYDLTQELELSLKYFIDTRNELIFLRKLHRHQYVSFSYNEINITNTTGLFNRMKFLENESAYRSNRMNQLFHQLQNVVIPSVIDDIRHLHSISYEKSWANRARYWFNQFKQIKWDKGERSNNNQPNYRAQKYQRSDSNDYGNRYYQSHIVKHEYDVTNTLNIKSEVVVKPSVPAVIDKSVKRYKNKIVEINGSNSHHNQQDLNKKQLDKGIQASIQEVKKTTAESIQSNDCNNNSILPSSVEEQSRETVNESKLDEHQAVADEESAVNDRSIIIVEQNISVVTVADDDNLDSGNNVLPEGDITN